MAEMQWIKLRIDMFDDEKIKIIQAMPDGDALLVVWIRLIALAGKCNAKGLVLVEDEFPYTDEMLATIFNKPLQTIRLALTTFKKFHMIENTTKGIYVTNFEKHQNIEGMDRIREQNRIRKQRERERKKILLLEESSCASVQTPDPKMDQNGNVTDGVTGMSRDMSCDFTQQREDKEKEYKYISSSEDILSDSSAELDPEMPKERITYRQIMDDYNKTCIDLPSIRAISEERKRKIRTLVNGMDKDKIMLDKSTYERIHIIFQMAHDSDFLSGRNGRWNGCSFDWLINKTNALKVLEGTYANKGGVNNVRSRTGDTGNGNAGIHNGAYSGTIESTTNEALERFRRNNDKDGV